MEKIIHIDTLNPALLIVESFTIGTTQTEKQIFDLTAHQGAPFRLYIERSGELSTDINRDHYWLLAEAMIPERKIESVTVEVTAEAGEEKTIMQEVPLNLHQVSITTFALPEVTEDGN